MSVPGWFGDVLSLKSILIIMYLKSWLLVTGHL